MLTSFGIGSVAVNEATGKSVTDHLISAANNQDCKTVRYFKDQPVCQDEVIIVTQPKTVVASKSNSGVDALEQAMAQRKGTK
jgi:hypothetical protein